MKAQEHRALGDEASAGATVDVAGMRLGFGDVVALAGDWFLPTAGRPSGEPGEALAAGTLFELAGHPQGREEIAGALRAMAADQGLVDPRFEQGGEFAGRGLDDGVERRVRDRFLALGASNDDHFVEPGGRGPATLADRPSARFGSAPAAYHHLHRRAVDEAHRLGRAGGEIEAAMAWEAAAQHYLTDAFSAGHVRTPVAAIREHWQLRYPWFWEGLRRKVASDTAAALREVAVPLRLLSPRSLHERTAAAVRARTAGYPHISFGDLVAKVFHDWDNVHGLVLEDGAVLFGDGCLEQGVTRQLAVRAARAGIDDVEVAFRLGRNGTRAAGVAAVARLPRLSADNPVQNWQAADVESLWELPVVGSTGTTVGQAVAAALEEGEELPNRLGCLGSGIAGDLDVPAIPGLRAWLNDKACEAYHRGFLEHLTSDPLGCVLEIVGRAAPVHVGTSGWVSR